jgi:cyclic 2,3-diphosphoglycerate synthetase
MDQPQANGSRPTGQAGAGSRDGGRRSRGARPAEGGLGAERVDVRAEGARGAERVEPPAAVVLIDGEHYPAVVRDALASLRDRYRLVGAVFLGGEEKLRDGDDDDELAAAYGLPLRRAREGGVGGRRPAAAAGAALEALLRESAATIVVDLSDEPVLGYRERFHLISVALARGARYVGADFDFSPPSQQRLSTAPSLAVIGTGKRVGKTAVSGFTARVLARRYAQGPGVVVVAMGRGGPAEPELLRGGVRLGRSELLVASRAGGHAASDHYEDAVLAGVTTVGCRRCGGGMAGSPFESNAPAGLALARHVPASLVVFEGSGSVVPPVRAEGVVCVSGAGQPTDYIIGYLGTYRLLISDLVVLTMCEEPFSDAAHVSYLREEIETVRPALKVVPTVFRPRPQETVAGERVAFFTTAPREAAAGLRSHLESEHGAEVVMVCPDLAHRQALREAVTKAARVADVFVTEIKAAAIDVVAEAAEAAGKRLVFCDNEPLAVDDTDLACQVEALAGRCEERFEERRAASAV